MSEGWLHPLAAPPHLIPSLRQGALTDTKALLQQILASPATAAFSRIRYVGTLMPEEEQALFGAV
ncbi:MAG: hypothetical protein HY680_05500 [Chloroflexi bacterium]|nr:hypothetical protein [Chloroflexota bacterium]